MKRIITALSAVVLAASLAACGGSDEVKTVSSTGPTTGQARPGSSLWRPPDTELSGSATITGANASYAVVVRDGLLTLRTTRSGYTGSPQVAALLGSDAAWRVVGGTSSRPAVVGVVPGRASTVVLRPVEGEQVPKHTVSLAAAGDFTAFVATFAQPLDTQTPAADIGWRLAGTPVTWALGADTTPVALSVTMQGEGPAPLPPYDFTRTGPPQGASSQGSVVVWVGMSSNRIGSEITATLQGDLTVLDPEGQRTRILGADPETSVGYSTFQLRDGRTLTWGVLPSGGSEVRLHLEGSARTGVPVYQQDARAVDRFRGSRGRCAGTGHRPAGNLGGGRPGQAQRAPIARIAVGTAVRACERPLDRPQHRERVIIRLGEDFPHIAQAAPPT